jgi:hypothetical protein
MPQKLIIADKRHISKVIPVFGLYWNANGILGDNRNAEKNKNTLTKLGKTN